ncbi:MAG: NAD(+) synthase [Candidatus Nealsonbacteria bacterium]|nr:NAD(+) synthase [Candidatus Nealsonbacteria bacterium]
MPHQILPKINYESVAQKISRFLKKEFKERNKSLAIVGVSGGVDSSLTAKLCEMAGLKLKKVFLPHGAASTEPDYSLKIDIASMVAEQVKKISEYAPLDKIDKGNIMARTRMIIQYALARQSNGLVVGTENLSEYYLGYFTSHGDQACDISPIAGLWKTQAIKMAEYLGLPTPEPSAGLWDGQTDEKELGFSYEEADPILYLYCVKKIKPETIIKDFGLSAKIVYKVVKQVDNTEYKREGVIKYD